MITIAIGNQKGGCGKTTTALTLGAVLASSGRRVLLVDVDPQSSATSILGIDATGRSLAEVIGGAEPGDLAMSDIIRPTQGGFDVAPADIALSRCELGLVQRLGRELVLRDALEALSGYDVCIVDCPPSLGLLTVNGLAAADGVIAPTLPAAPDLRGLRLFLDTLEKIRPINRKLQLAGVVVTQFDGRTNAHQDALELLQRSGLPVWLPPVPRSVRVQESHARHQSLDDYDPGGRVFSAYSELSKGLIKWLTENEKKFSRMTR